MKRAIALVTGLSGKPKMRPMPHRNIRAAKIGTGEYICIKCPTQPQSAAVLPQVEYFFNLHGTATAFHRAARRKARGNHRKVDREMESPEVAVEFYSPKSARLVYDANDAFQITNPDACKSLEGDLVARIDEAFYGKDFSEITSVIAYDPETYEKGADSPYKFISVARRSDAAKEAIHEVPSFDSGSGEGQKTLCYPNIWHPARVTGKRYAVPSPEFMEAEAPEGMLYVQIPGMAQAKISDDTAFMVMSCCADAFFPDKENANKE
jgi:hypothetical protein